jgi:hypothetical protein
MTRTRNKEKALRRYKIEYFLDARRLTRHDAQGSCETFAAACGNAARHIARSDFLDGGYRRAAIVDRWHGKVVRLYSRTGDGISIKEY